MSPPRTDPVGGVSPPGLDLRRLQAYLDAARPGLVTGQLSAELIPGGRSNLSYVVTDGQRRWVARRPPLGHVLPTAHDMAREFRVISALRPTAVPVPPTVLLCEDADVLGAPFYLMDYVDGAVLRTRAQTAALGPDRAVPLAHQVIDVLADLHEVDPGSVGLADFGRPEGFLQRQLRRWWTQLEASRSRDVPGLDELHARLAASVPERESGAGIVHGDYRLDNTLVGANDVVVAVLDWEMSTLGDPLADLGLFRVYWDGIASLGDTALTATIQPGTAFPSGAELAARYAARRDADLSRLGWYVALGFFKLAVILEGIHYRFLAGQTVGAGFDRIGEVVPGLAGLGHDALAEEP